MVVLTIECLLKSGLKEFQLEIGHADLLRGLVEEAGFSEAEAAQLFELIESKNFFGVEELLDRLTVSEPLKEIFVSLSELQGSFDESEAFVKERTSNERVLKALDRLKKGRADRGNVRLRAVYYRGLKYVKQLQLLYRRDLPRIYIRQWRGAGKRWSL